MINLQKVETRKSLMKGKYREYHSLSLISVNPDSIITVQPVSSGLIKEINGEPCPGKNFTKVTYNLGASVETITVLGEYAKIMNKISNKTTRAVLHD